MISKTLRMILTLGVTAGLADGDTGNFFEVLPAAADTYLRSYMPETPSSSSTIRVAEGHYKGGLRISRSLVRFDIDVPADLIAQATLQLHCHGLYPYPLVDEAEFALHALTSSWEEHAATWWWRRLGDTGEPVYWEAYHQGLPAYGPGGGDYAPEPTTVFSIHVDQAWQFIPIDITALVRDWQAGVIPNHGVLIKFLEETEEPLPGTDTRSTTFTTRQHPESEFHPRLEIRLHIPGDLNGDGSVDHSDLALLLAAWNTVPGDPAWNPDADVSGDGHIHHADLAILLSNYGRTLHD